MHIDLLCTPLQEVTLHWPVRWHVWGMYWPQLCHWPQLYVIGHNCPSPLYLIAWLSPECRESVDGRNQRGGGHKAPLGTWMSTVAQWKLDARRMIQKYFFRGYLLIKKVLVITLIYPLYMWVICSAKHVMKTGSHLITFCPLGQTVDCMLGLSDCKPEDGRETWKAKC